MEFVSSRELRINTGEVWEKLSQEKELVITLNGKPMALMTGITGESLEVILNAVRRARGEWAIRQMRQMSQKSGLDKLTDKQINTEIDKVRREHRRENRS